LTAFLDCRTSRVFAYAQMFAPKQGLLSTTIQRSPAWVLLSRAFETQAHGSSMIGAVPGANAMPSRFSRSIYGLINSPSFGGA